MKIRTDFVTNSSSVSYILTLNEKLADAVKSWFLIGDEKENKTVKELIFHKLKDFIKDDGEKVELAGYTI